MDVRRIFPREKSIGDFSKIFVGVAKSSENFSHSKQRMFFCCDFEKFPHCFPFPTPMAK